MARDLRTPGQTSPCLSKTFWSIGTAQLVFPKQFCTNKINDYHLTLNSTHECVPIILNLRGIERDLLDDFLANG